MAFVQHFWKPSPSSSVENMHFDPVILGEQVNNIQANNPGLVSER